MISWTCHLLLFFILLLAIPVTCRHRHHRHPKEPDPLFLAWKNFSILQRDQYIDFNRDFPVDQRLFANLKKCGRYSRETNEHLSDSLPPQEVSIYAEVGHLTTFCRRDFFLELQNDEALDLNNATEKFRAGCLESMHVKSKFPTLSKMLQKTGAELSIVESNIIHKNFQAWTKHVIHLIERIPNYESKWKLILLAPGLFDVLPGHPTWNFARTVLQSIQLINHHLPDKTMIVLLRNSRWKLWHSFAHDFPFCKKLLGQWQMHDGKSDESWAIAEERIKKNFQTAKFYVHIATFMEDAKPLKYGQMLDVSILSTDCIHLSARGLSLVHLHLWNWLVQINRQIDWSPLVRPLYCPRPNCPYFVTKTNTYFCPQRKYRFGLKDTPGPESQYIVFSILLMTILLYGMLLIYVAFSSI